MSYPKGAQRMKVDFTIEGPVIKKKTGLARDGRNVYEFIVDDEKYDQEITVKVPEEEYNKINRFDNVRLRGQIYVTIGDAMLYCKQPEVVNKTNQLKMVVDK